ncbi:hypothetical protein EC991_007769 [Linnemannia zychae]|nr:hypothetical protein EC991_007769 [Linnemannia zychae]
MQPPPLPESTARQQQQQAATRQVSSASTSLTRHGQADATTFHHTDTELSSPGTLFRVASEQQQQQPNHPPHTRPSSLGHTRNSNSISSINNGNHSNVNNKGAPVTTNTAASAATAMGDGIINQSMKEDLDNWLTALGLAPGQPVNVVGYFGHCKDLSMFERIAPAVRKKDGTYETSSCIGSFEDDERMPVFYDGCRDSPESRPKHEPGLAGGTVQNGGWTLGLNDQKTTGDIHMFLDKTTNTLMLQHAYIYDTQEMLSACQESADAINKDRTSLMKWMHDQEYESHRALLFLFLVSHVVVHTSPDMNLDSRMISVLAALSTIKRQMLQELDRFMAICWDRIGVPPPDHDRNQSENGGGGGGRGSNPLASILTPGRCVPALVFVIERVPIIAPWHEAGANENQIVEQLRQQLLKKSIDAMQTRLRYLFRACRLIQSVDSSAGAFDGRQLFVLPSPSSTPFVHVIPHFIGQLELPETSLNYSEDNGNEPLDPAAAVLRTKMRSSAGGSQSTKKQGLNAKSLSTKSQRDKTTTRSIADEGNHALGNPTLREIYDAIVKARDQSLPGASLYGTKSPADGSSQLSLGGLYLEYSGPLLRQFVDGWVRNVTSPGGYGSIIGRRHIGSVEDDFNADESLGSKAQNASISGGSTNGEVAPGGAAAVRERGSRRGGGKKYSLRCAHLVQKKIQDFVQTDEVMEELYGQKPELAATRAHSERYHQLKADQATKLFNSLAYRR